MLGCDEMQVETRPRVQVPVEAIVESADLARVYETIAVGIYAKAYYFVDAGPQCREKIEGAIETLVAHDHIVAVYSDREQEAAFEDAKTWRVPEQQIPSFNNGPATIVRRYKEYEQAYFIPLADITMKDVRTPGAPGYVVIIPETLKNDVLVMYAEQQTHPAAVFYECKKS